jgi:hypothetical protein
MQRAEQQQAVREWNASARSAARVAQSVEHQQAVRERHASAGRAARATQSAEQQQAVKERDASARRAARAVEPAEHQQTVRERDASARRIYTWPVVCGHVAHWVPRGRENAGYRWVGECSWRCPCRCVYSKCCLHRGVITWSCKE